MSYIKEFVQKMEALHSAEIENQRSYDRARTNVIETINTYFESLFKSLGEVTTVSPSLKCYVRPKYHVEFAQNCYLIVPSFSEVKDVNESFIVTICSLGQIKEDKVHYENGKYYSELFGLEFYSGLLDEYLKMAFDKAIDYQLQTKS